MRDGDRALRFRLYPREEKRKRKQSQEVLDLELAPISTARLAVVICNQICNQITNYKVVKKGDYFYGEVCR